MADIKYILKFNDFKELDDIALVDVAEHTSIVEYQDGQRILAEMRSGGVTHVVLEVSSHAIDLSRIEGCRLDMGVFTNLTQDHLDYHGNMDRYWACKKRLFTQYLGFDKNPLAVINTESPQGLELV